EQRHPVLLQHPAPVGQPFILPAFHQVALFEGVVLLPEGLQLLRPDPVTLNLPRQLVQALTDSGQVARVLAQPLWRNLADEPLEDQILQVGADVRHGNGMGKVDTPLQTFLDGMPGPENIQHLARQLLGGRHQLRPPLLLTYGEGLRRTRQFTVLRQAGAIDGREQYILRQLLLIAQFAVIERCLTQRRQFLPEELRLFGHALQQQTLHAPPVGLLRLHRVVEQLLHHGSALLYPGGPEIHFDAGLTLAHAYRQLLRAGRRSRPARVGDCRRLRLALLTQFSGQLHAERTIIAATGDRPAFRIHHQDTHQQVVLQLNAAPGVFIQPHAGHAGELPTQRLGQPTFTEGHPLQRRPNEVRYRYEVLAQGLGQPPYQRHALVVDQSRDQPLQPLLRQLSQQRK